MQACYPRNSGGGGQNIKSLRPAAAKLLKLCLKNKIKTTKRGGRIVQVVGHLPCNPEAQGSISGTAK